MEKTFTELWQKEYQSKGIPSSYRQDPTKILTKFVSFLHKNNIHSGKAIDLGCGRGRNAFYLAEHGYSVICMDLVEENVTFINQKADERKIPLRAYCKSITSPWPVKNKELDIAIDIFCYKHIVSKEAQKQYRKHLKASLKDHGYYLLSLAADDDGFYSPLLANSENPSLKLIVDPYSQIRSFLYSIDEITNEFSDVFNVIDASKDESISPMHGKEYKRQVINVIFQKKRFS